MEEQVAELQRETRSSIELQRAKDGTYYWMIKIYFEPSDDLTEAALDRVQEIDTLLRRGYLPRVAPGTSDPRD